MVIGHNQNIEWLNSMNTSASFPHTLLFVGERGIGKLDVALCCARWLEEGGSLLDIARQDSTPSTSAHQFYFSNPQISDIRQLRSRIAKSSFQGKNRTVIIDNAELLSREAANALLTTLEEPRGKTVFILISSHEKRVLSTIRSRAMIFTFTRVDTALIREALDTTAIEDALDWWDGKPRITRDLLQDTEYHQHVFNMLKDARTFLEDDMSVSFKILETYKGDDLKDFLHAIVLSVRRQSPGTKRQGVLKECMRLSQKVEQSNSNLLLSLRRLYLQRI